MAALSSTTSATTPGANLSALQYKLQQARQDAARAEDNLASLQNQTEEAQRQAEASQRNVETLQSQSQQVQSQASVSHVNQVSQETKSLLAKTPSPALGAYVKLADDAVRQGFRLQTGPTAQLFVNVQGQSTGRLVSIKA